MMAPRAGQVVAARTVTPDRQSMSVAREQRIKGLRAVPLTMMVPLMVRRVVVVALLLSVLTQPVQPVALGAQAYPILFLVVRCNTAVVVAVLVAQQRARVALGAVALGLLIKMP